MLQRMIRSGWARVVAAAALGIVLAALSACRTTEGAGKDIKNLGKNIEDSADKHAP